MLIFCPHCGMRPSEEFTPKGLAEAPRPALGGDDRPEDDAWQDYLHTRTNKAGQTNEYFHHSLGCRRWIVVHRNPLTHEVTGSTMASEFWQNQQQAQDQEAGQ